MSMRSYSGLLVLESVFDNIPNQNPDLVSLASTVFQPNVPIVEVDCGTTLGNFRTVDYSIEGFIELATGQPISKTRLETLLYSGIYSTATRSVSTCVSTGGICQTCYAADNVGTALPLVGTRVTVQPKYLLSSDVINALQSQFSWTISVDTSQFATVDVFIQGKLQDPSTYSIVGSTFTLVTPIASDQNIVLHYYSFITSPFLVYLAKTYSGSILGMKALPAPMLPLRSLLISSLIPKNKLELVIEYTKEIPSIPEDHRTYIDSIQDTLEKTLYILAINCIFSNTGS